MPPGVSGLLDSGSGASRVHSTKPSGARGAGGDAKAERVAGAPALRRGVPQQGRRRDQGEGRRWPRRRAGGGGSRRFDVNLTDMIRPRPAAPRHRYSPRFVTICASTATKLPFCRFSPRYQFSDPTDHGRRPVGNPQAARRAPGSKRCATGSSRRSRRWRTPCPRTRRWPISAAGRFVRTPWNRTDHTRRAGRRRRHGDDEGPRVREGRRPRLDRVRRVRAGIPQGDSRRRRRPALLRHRHFAHRPPAQPPRAGGAHEHPLRRDHESVVRRRRRPDPRARSAGAPRTTPTRSPSTRR